MPRIEALRNTKTSNDIDAVYKGKRIEVFLNSPMGAGIYGFPVIPDCWAFVDEEDVSNLVRDTRGHRNVEEKLRQLIDAERI